MTAKITQPIAPRIKIPYSVPVTMLGICHPRSFLTVSEIALDQRRSPARPMPAASAPIGSMISMNTQ